MPAWRSASTQSAAMAMLGAWVSRSISGRRRLLGCPFGGAFRILVEPPGVALQRDAPPSAALLGRRHLGPSLHLLEGAPAALAIRVALAGRADRDARRVRRGVVPGFPGRIGGRRKAVLVGFVLVIEDQERIHLGQG